MSTIPRVSLKRGRDKIPRRNALDVQQQLNSQPQSISVLDGNIPAGLRSGDRTFRRTKTGIAIGIADSKGNPNEVVINQTALNNQKAPQSGAGNPTTTQFPNPGDFGWYTNTSSGDVMFVVNIAGTITFQSIDKLTGSITFAQHGNLSGAGNAHNFTDITGTITGTQHGSLGSGSQHLAVTTTVNGFMTAADKVILNGAVNTATANAIAQRDASGNCNFAIVTATTVNATTQYDVAGVKVVDNRVTGWGAPTGTVSRAALTLVAAGAYSQTDFDTVIQSLKAVITDLRAHGLIGT